MSLDDCNANQIKEHDMCPRACRALWCAVIQEQLNLAVSPRMADHPHEVAAARRWFGSRDFFMACSLAGLDGAWVLCGVRHQFQMVGVV